MRIGIIGTGRIGGGLAERFAAAGHDVRLGSRDPARGRPYREVAQEAEVVVLAVPWSVAEETVSGLGDLAGKVVVDTMNPYANEGQRPLPELYGTSGAER